MNRSEVISNLRTVAGIATAIVAYLSIMWISVASIPAIRLDGNFNENYPSGEKIYIPINVDDPYPIPYTFEKNDENRIIIQFYEEPVLNYARLLKEEYSHRGDINQTETRATIKAYKDSILNIHSKVRNEISQNNIKIKYTREYSGIFNGFAAEISKEDIPNLKKIPNIKAIYADQKVYTSLNDSIPIINATFVWILLDSNGSNITGKGVKVAILDTGIDYTHPDLGGGFGPAYKVNGGWDVHNNDPDPMDDNGHGTHVAGIVAANGSLKGVAPDVQLMAYKVMDSGGSGSWSSVIAGIEMAVDPDGNPLTNDGADIMSLSLGGQGDPDDPASQAVDNAVENGIVAVVAAGNKGNAFIDSPGTARKAITVGAVDKQDIIAYFSSRGPVLWRGGTMIKPEIVSPGVNINSSVPLGSCTQCTPTGYKLISGTSMATPHVSGAAALLLQLHPDWTPEQVRSALVTTAINLSYDVYTQGAGRIDVLKAASVEAVVDPSILSLGLVNKTLDVWQVNRNIEIRNIARTTKDFHISVQMPYIEGITTNLSVSSITLNPETDAIINFSVSVNNSITLDGQYEGFILVTSTTETLKIPFAFIKRNTLILEFSESADVLMIHNRNNSYRWISNPGNFSISFVDPGTYDVMTKFGSKTVVREGIDVTGPTKININSSEAKHKVEIIKKDEIGRPINVYEGTSMFVHKGTEYGWYTFGGLGDTFYFSNLSDAYKWDWNKIYQTTERVYIINEFIRDGISGNMTFDIKGEDYRNLKIIFHPNIQTQDVSALYGLYYFRPGDGEHQLTSINSINGGKLSEAYAQDLYIIPHPSDFLFNRINIEIRNFSTNELLFQSPYLFIKNDSIERSFYPWGSFLPPLSGNNIHIGLNPEQWAGKFSNFENYISVIPRGGSVLPPYGYFWPFLTQNYDIASYNNLPYKLYKNGIMVDNGTINMIGQPRHFIIRTYDEGKKIPRVYSLIIERNYSTDGFNITTMINATFNLYISDMNPPSLPSMNLIANGELTDMIDHSKNNWLNFTVDPNGGSINSVQVYFNSCDGWTQLSLINYSLDYSAEIPINNNCSIYSFKIIVLDDSSNSLEYRFEVPSKPSIRTVDDSGGAYYTSIQAAINIANTGDTIRVNSGTYYENINVNKQLFLEGIDTGGGNPVLDGRGTGNTITLAADGILLENFTSTNSTGSSYASIKVTSKNNNITNNTIRNNDYGIRILSSSNNIIANNNFNNTHNFAFDGIINSNNWNIQKIHGTNIIGGLYIGGNFWGNPSGTGFSQTCADDNYDGICDSSYVFNSDNIDYLPLATIPLGYGYISGKVLNNSVGIANVIMTTNSSNSTTTDTSGFYSLYVPAGKYNLTATMEPVYYPNSSVMVTVISGTNVVQDIELLMKPTGNISGVVTEV